MSKVKLLVSIVAIMLTVGVTSQVALGSAAGPPEMVVLVVDRELVAGTPGASDLIESLVGLLSILRGDHLFLYVSADEPDQILGPVLPGDSQFRTFQSRLEEELTSPQISADWDFVDALAAVYNRLSDEGAAPGSTVYLVTGGSSQPELVGQASVPGPIVDLLAESGWPIFGLSLPETSEQVSSDLHDLSVFTGGKSFGLSVPEGLASLSDDILTSDTRGSLDMINLGILDERTIFTSFVTIAPGTSETTLLFFKQAVYGSLRLSNPSGFEVSAGDRASSSVLETPHAVIWKLEDPVPGRWKIDVRGLGGVVSAWQSTVNKYGLVLEQMGPVPLGKPATLIASVRDGYEKVVLSGVRVSATLTSPDGADVIYELNDFGVAGDSVAGDGFFSSTLPPMASSGEYSTKLDLYWPEFDHRITSDSVVIAQAFPTIDLTTLRLDNLRPGERAAVATMAVHVEGQPYAVSVDEVVSSVSVNSGSAGSLEVKPQQLVSSDRAWIFDVFFTPSEEGRHTLIFHLITEYAGRQYTFTTDSFVVTSSVPPVAPLEPVAVATPLIPVTVPPVRSTALASDSSGLPWALMAIPIAALVLLAIWALWWMSLSRPYGFLYNDQDELEVDFSAIRRNALMRLLFKDRVPGRELAVQGLEGISFKFWTDKIGIRSGQPTPTVRVNSQTLLGEAIVEERAWIGTRGRLYSFLTSPLQATPEPSAADD